MSTIQLTPTVRIVIDQDQDPTSPADWDTLGSIAYCSRRETLGTENVTRDRLDEIAKGIRAGTLIGLPVYAYVHSGTSIATTPFHCQWDSGQSGFVYCTRERAMAEFGKPDAKRITPSVKSLTLACLQSEVETFSQYLEGDVWYFSVQVAVTGPSGNTLWDTVESCGSFYGITECEEEARACAECHIQYPAPLAL